MPMSYANEKMDSFVQWLHLIYLNTATIDIVSQLGNTNLYCSSMNAMETLTSPALYCLIQGHVHNTLSFCLTACDCSSPIWFDGQEWSICVCCRPFSVGPVLTGFLIFMVLAWLLHTCLIFYKIVFPIHALRTKQYYKWIHLSLLIFGKYPYTHSKSQAYTRVLMTTLISLSLQWNSAFLIAVEKVYILSADQSPMSLH